MLGADANSQSITNYYSFFNNNLESLFFFLQWDNSSWEQKISVNSTIFTLITWQTIVCILMEPLFSVARNGVSQRQGIAKAKLNQSRDQRIQARAIPEKPLWRVCWVLWETKLICWTLRCSLNSAKTAILPSMPAKAADMWTAATGVCLAFPILGMKSCMQLCSILRFFFFLLYSDENGPIKESIGESKAQANAYI